MKKAELEEIIGDILDHRLCEMGYNDKEDVIVDYCLQAVPKLKNDYDWEEPELDEE